MEIQRLQEAAQELLNRFLEGDDDAVLDPSALELARELEALSGTDPAAALTAGHLAYFRYFANEDILDVTDLDLALTLFAEIPHQQLPSNIGEMFATGVNEDLEAALPGAPCHPSQLVTAAVRLRDELKDDHSKDDCVLLCLAVGLTRLAFEYSPVGSELAGRVLYINAEAVLRVVGVGVDRARELIRDIVAALRQAGETAGLDDDARTEIREFLGRALLMLASIEPDSVVLAEAGSLLEADLSSPVAAATWLRDYYVSNRRINGFDYMYAAYARGAASLYRKSGLDLPDGFLDVPPPPTFREIIGPDVHIAGSEPTEIPSERGRPLRVASSNMDELVGQHFEAELAKLPRRDRGGRAALMAELADHYRHRFRDRRQRSFLDEAFALAQRAVRLCPRRDARRPDVVLALYRCLLIRYSLDGRRADLDAAIDRLREMLTFRSGVTPETQSRCSADLASCLMVRYAFSDDVKDVREAYAAAKDGVLGAPTGSDTGLLACGVLGAVLMTAYQAGFPDADLDAAVTLLREGAELPGADENRPTVLNNLSRALVVRYLGGGDIGDLDDAIDAARSAWSVATEWLRFHETYEALGDALQLRYLEQGSLSDLDDSIQLAREALEGLPEGHSQTPLYQADLAKRLAGRVQRVASPEGLAEPIRLARTAVAAADGPLITGYARDALAAVLATPTGTPIEISHLREAAALYRQLSPTTRGRLALARIIRELIRYGEDDRTELSREAEKVLRAALRDSADVSQFQLELGEVLYERALTDADQFALQEASGLFRAVALDPGSPPPRRVTAARLWGEVLGELGSWPDAVAAYALAIDLLPQIAPRTLARIDQEKVLSDAADLASDACAAAIRAGTPVEGIRLFEAGRGILWSQFMETSDDLGELSSVAPELAERLARLREELAAPEVAVGPVADTAGRLADRRRAVALALTDLLAEIRDVLPDFGTPSRRPALHPGVDGIVVLVIASTHGGHAILLHPDDNFEVLDLPDLSKEAARRAGDRITQALLALQGPATTVHARQQADADILAALDWLAATATRPVIDRLGEGVVRVFWVAAGAVTALPLHAAGDALARARSSYGTTLQALYDTTRHAAPEQPRMLVVAMPETPGAPSLPGVAAETALLRERYEPVELIEVNATRAAVLAALAQCDIVHFACHTALVPEHPGATRFLLHDHRSDPLTVLEVAGLNLPDAYLAFLSSCTTVLSGRGLADEAVHLAESFRHAGFTHVVGSLWPIADRAALAMAARFYASRDEPAEAVRAAALALSQDSPKTPSLWACLVHLGP
jgi:tetratricopeptide (TPR) repeat protein